MTAGLSPNLGWTGRITSGRVTDCWLHLFNGAGSASIRLVSINWWQHTPTEGLIVVHTNDGSLHRIGAPAPRGVPFDDQDGPAASDARDVINDLARDLSQALEDG